MKNRLGWYSGSGDQNGINTKNPNKAFNPAWCRRNLRAVNNRDKVFWEQHGQKNTYRVIFLLFQSKIVWCTWRQSNVQNSKLPRQFFQNILQKQNHTAQLEIIIIMTTQQWAHYHTTTNIYIINTCSVFSS